MDRGAREATVHGVARSWTRLNDSAKIIFKGGESRRGKRQALSKEVVIESLNLGLNLEGSWTKSYHRIFLKTRGWHS